MKPKFWAIIVLVTLAATVSIIFYIRQPALDLGLITVHHQPQLHPIATTTIQSDLKEWKTYTNSQYGFEFQYPQNLIIYLDKDGKLILDTPETKKMFEAKSLSRVGDLIVYVDPNPKNLPAKDFYNRPNSFFRNPQSIKVGSGILSYEVAGTETGDPSLTSVSIPADKNFIEFSSFLDINSFKKILSTFKFTK
jgi:hypothetical protein